MAVTANQLINAQDPSCRRSYPVAASKTIYGGTIVFAASGYASDDDNGGSNVFIGIAVDNADNASGSAGDINVDLYSKGAFVLTGSGFSQANVGALCYASDNYTVTTSATSTTKIGRIVEFISSTQVRVEIETVVDQ